MIKFFRRIRQNLLMENKTGKYFKYAIGEIVLVVIGILIALSINNWNEERKERKKEINYLENLKIDLQHEILNSEQYAEYHFKKVQACAKLINGDAPKNIKDAQVYTDTYEVVFRWKDFVPNNNTFKELLSSGNLSLIKNDSIKNGLLELENNYASIAGNEYHMRREFEEYLYDPHVKNISAIEFFDTTTPTDGLLIRLKAQDIPESRRDKVISDAAWQHNNQTFTNGLKLAMMNNTGLGRKHMDQVAFIHELIQLIDVEINK
ncbi:DUF6090 family protein [Robiginitalea aurantiaca]|uniref:DUF6090 family protein n=1 Tax=Robiginitalea aurantiaca TaxID=3056915 RepID=A0ABT7WEY7_9FLAO|nr:DUF6090 family protein [Robiginitalea aurantiaca]MDM9631485.1 DUF6090 family protein [Robiginitalea aurantiaca]